MKEKIIRTENKKEEEKFFTSLRPEYLDQYIGQEKIKNTMKIYIEAAKKRGEPLDHVLLYGPPGLGKTTLAMIIANELGVNIKVVTGPVIERAGDIIAILNNIKAGDILFIDEIHRLNRQVEEILYPAMEDFFVDILIGSGPQAKSIRHKLPKFTLIGATTRAGMLSAPLRDRFGVTNHMEFYTPNELSTIIQIAAGKLNTEIDEDAAMELARRSRGTPRLANRLLKRIRDFADVKNNGIINIEITREALETLDIDKMGLDMLDRAILETIIEQYGGGPVGLDAISSSIGEDKNTIEDVYEPYLVKEGYINRTPRGREASKKAYLHLGKNYK